jgi:hypothetical protein
MPTKIKTWDDLIGLWPTVAAFGEDAGEGTPKGEALKPTHVHTLKARKKVPSDYWPGIVAGAKRRDLKANGRPITAELLLEIQTYMAEIA